MKQGIYLGKHAIEVRESPLPTIGADDVLLKNLYSGICGTDVAVYQHGTGTGHRITAGEEFGHETISEIVAVGENVTGYQVGDRVYPYPRLVKDDPKRAGTIGGFSEYIAAINVTQNHSLYPIDAAIPDKIACLTEPFTVGCRAARRGMIPDGTSPDGRKSYVKGQNAVIFGAGTIGLAAACAFQYFGMDKVMLCDHSEYRLQIARSFGFETCNPMREAFLPNASSYFHTAPSLNGPTADIDCWMDAAGAESILEQFLSSGKIESRFVSVAVNNSIRNVDLLHMTYAQQTLIGSGGYTPEDVDDVQRIMTCGKWDFEKMITHEFPIEQLETAIQTASDVDHAGNVIINWQL